MKKEKVALVLSGGAALGAIELGILSVLEEKYEFNFFAGTSVGSLIIGFLLQNKKAEEILKIFTKGNIKKILTDFSTKGFGIVKGDNFLKFLEESFESKLFEDFDIPTTFVSTNFKNGERINVSKGPISEAVRASCGIPVMFEPYWHKPTKKWLVDGGLCQNFPLDIATNSYSGTKIIAIDVGVFIDESVDFSDTNIFSNMKNIKPTINRVLRIMMKNQHKKNTDNRVEIFKPDIKNFSFLNFRQKKFEEMFAFGKQFAEKQLSNR